MKDLKSIVEQAKKALESIKHGETYTSDYIINRFSRAADNNPNDQLIGNMRDVLSKRASKQIFFNQSDIGNLYNEMYGMASGHTAFRSELGDLLPESMQFSKIAHTGSNLRKMEEINPEPLYEETDLSRAFSSIFSLGSNSAFASFRETDPDLVKKAVSSKLSQLGKVPVQISVAGQNEHFALATAIYQDRNHNQLSLNIPVQISDGRPQEPTMMIQAGELIDLNKDNLYVHLKEVSRYKKASSQASIAGDVGRDRVEVDKAVVPVSLEKWAKFDTDLIRAGNNFEANQINMGASLVSSEIASLTSVKAQIKVASSDESGIVFSATLPTPNGRVVSLDVPVEYHSGRPILPSKFALSNEIADANTIYDFDKRGFDTLWERISDQRSSDNLNKIARINSDMGKMSYHQLMDQVITAAATKDYALAEDAIGVIRNNMGEELASKALGEYARLLKHSSAVSTKRDEFVKMAKSRGDLISIPTSVEPYAPKLGLTLSRIDFDSDGNMYPKGRVPKYDNQNDDIQVIQTSKIYLS